MNQWMELCRRFLRESQNADGGWGFFPGKQSWLEPTAYATLALQGDPGSREAVERAWKLVRSWQLPDGSWQPNAVVREPHWTTALAVTLHGVRGIHDDVFRRGVDWLLATSGSENGWRFRIAHVLRPSVVEIDPGLKAWPWLPGNSSWIEPTAHSLVALKKASAHYDGKLLKERVSLGEQMILERRCSDGGWNYGNRKVLGTVLPSYPETTAIALLGLAGNRALDLAGPIKVAQQYWRQTRSPLARAWLRVSLKSYGISLPAVEPAHSELQPLADIMISALELLGESGGLA